ncbi:hypothetical protein PCANB_001456 [Pneumocystis canis]|nr:hypothetical protein PCANB_001456 [Pneumocystis canis]
MSVVGSAVFCTDCGSLLDFTLENDLICHECNSHFPISLIDGIHIVTLLEPPTFASTLRQRRKQRISTKNTNIVTSSTITPTVAPAATIYETCPVCGYSEMSFYALQMRSADEGSTIFYNCIHCG